jgi:hypothetical protein
LPLGGEEAVRIPSTLDQEAQNHAANPPTSIFSDSSAERNRNRLGEYRVTGAALKKHWDWAVLGLIACLFLFAASRELSLPALYYDESFNPIYGMELALGLPRTPTDWAISFGGDSWPLRSYHTREFHAFDIYWSALAFRVGGVSVATLRWAALLISTALLASFYGFCRTWFPKRVGLAACALLAAHPAFLICSPRSPCGLCRYGIAGAPFGRSMRVALP